MIPESAGGEVHKSVWNLQEEILQVTGTALSTQKQKLHNSSDTPYMTDLKNLSANSSGKKTSYFNHRYTGLQNKTAFVVWQIKWEKFLQSTQQLQVLQ